MIDIHTHILPGLDDGSMDMRESMEMAELAVEGGTNILVATPHANQMRRFENFFSEEFKERYFSLQDRLAEEKLPLTLILGMEIMANCEIGFLIHMLNEKKLIGLNGSDYYLVEFPFEVSANYISAVIEAIFDYGGIPLIAHPERYTCIQRHPEYLLDWIREGISTQINKGSILGTFGEGVQRTAEILLKNDLVTCVASDAHGTVSRTPWMKEINTYLTEKFSKEYADRLLVKNPGLILQNKDVPFHGRWEEGEE